MRTELHKTALSSADAGLTRTMESAVLKSKFSKEIERTSPSGRGYIYTDTMVYNGWLMIIVVMMILSFAHRVLASCLQPASCRPYQYFFYESSIR